MKVNLRKIGAIVAGATILASSAAFAGLMFGSTTLVDDNGAPVAKVVVGSAAHPSDGVAAALIAGKMVSETYKSAKLTAQVSGTATCAAANGTNGSTGTCAISNEKARLEITVPGSVASGTWTGNNLIGDYVDRTLLDRRPDNDSLNTDSAYPIGGADTSDNANPFTDGHGGNIGLSQVFMYRVSGNVLSTFASRTLTDTDSGKNYVEKQDLWIYGDNKYSKDDKEVVGDLKFLAYTLKFDGPGGKEIGIPVCTKAVDTDYTACKDTPTPAGTSVDDATETHRLKLGFLGEDWIISYMEAPTTNISSETNLVNGGTVKLAKESVSGILNQGESLPVDNLKFQLDDLEAHGDTTSAILSILDANGNVLKKDKVLPSETKEYSISGKKYRFHVYKVAPGYTFGAKWADVAIFSKELELKDGQKLDQGQGTNDGYRVALGWKNLEATATQQSPDALRTMVVYSDSIDQVSSSGDDALVAGDYVPIVQDPAVWRLTYKGLDLDSSNKYKLKFDLKTDDKTISSSYGPLNATPSRVNCTIFGPYMEVSSSASGGVFTITRTDSTGEISDSRFYVALKGQTDAEHAAQCGYNSSVAANLTVGTVFMKESASSSNYGYALYTHGAVNASAGLEVKYQAIGDGDTAFAPPRGGAVLIEWGNATFAGDGHIGNLLISAGYSFANATPTASTLGDAPTAAGNSRPQVWFATAEKAGTGTSSSFVDYYMFGVRGLHTGTAGDATMDFTSTDGTTTLTSDNDKLLYGHAVANTAGYYAGGLLSGPVTPRTELVDTGYISERGSKYDSQSSTSVGFTMAHKLAYAQWFLAPSSTSTASSTKSIVTLGEGESTTISGVTVKVLEITEDVGACSAAGGSSACTPNMAGVSAVIMPNNAAEVDVAMPYAYSSYGNLVILDQDAVGVNTLVSVGGDAVNTVTAGLLQGSAVDWSAERKVVKEVVQGSKIVVAGKEKEDTLEAASDFVAQLKKA
jgi:hypothetical protein